MHRDPLPLLPPITPNRKRFPFAGQVLVGDIVVDVENPAGSVRRGTDRQGKPWSVKMTHHYGEIWGTTAADGDALDVYVGENPDSPEVFIIAQNDSASGRYDEDKAFLGFNSPEEAIACYRNHNPNPGAMGGVCRLPVEQLADAVHSGRIRGGRVDRKLLPGFESEVPDPIQRILVGRPPQPAPAEILFKGRIFVGLRKAEPTPPPSAAPPGTAAGLAAVTPEDLERMAALLKGEGEKAAC